MSSWQSELERLTRPTEFTHAQLESSRMRRHQMQEQTRKTQTGTNTFDTTSVFPEGVTARARSNSQPGIAGGACERCHRQNADTYCTQCDQLACNQCDAATHAMGASRPSSHHRVPAAGVAAYRLPCSSCQTAYPTASSTDTRLAFYCRPCGQPACAMCQRPGGSHAATGGVRTHACVPLVEEFQSQLRQLQAAVGADGTVQRKKKYLANEVQTQYTRGASAALAAAVASVESHELTQAQHAIYRVNNIAEVNGVKLSQSIDRLQSDISSVDSFLSASGLVAPPPVDAAAADVPVVAAPSSLPTATPAEMSRFLAHTREWLPRAHAFASLECDSIDSLALSPLPHDSADRARSLAQFPRLLQMLRVKDELIRFAMASRKGLLAEQETHARTLQRLYEQSQSEMEEWMALSERLAQEMRDTKQKCAFCAVALSGAAASTPCAANTSAAQMRAAIPAAPGSAMTGSFEGSERREGDGLHYFVPA